MLPKQPPGSKTCGHHCLAVILSIGVHQAIALIGHERGTKTKELTRHFRHGQMRRGTPFRYSLCINRSVTKSTGRWHWVLFLEGKIYCPNVGEWVDATSYCTMTGTKISSSIEILEPRLSET